MAREDILVDSTYGELVTADNPAGRVIYDFVLLEEVAGMDNEHYAYGEISLAQEAERRYDEGSSVHVRIPYTAVYLPLRVRFHIATPGGGEHYMVCLLYTSLGQRLRPVGVGCFRDACRRAGFHESNRWVEYRSFAYLEE